MSIQEVATAAGVPYSTTWRVLNRVPGVSPAAVEAVNRAVKVVGYTRPIRRNIRGLPSPAPMRSRNIALLHLRQSSALSTSIVRAVQKILIEQDMNLMFGHVSGPEDLPRALNNGEIDGILGYGQFPALAATQRMMQIPAVWMMSRFDNQPDPWGDRVMPDHAAIGQLAAKYLLDKGHNHLAYLNPGSHVPFLVERGVAFAAAAAQRDALADLVAIRRSTLDRERDINQLIDLWASLSPRPTGLFVTSDSAAVSFYRQFHRRGILPGRDVELVSCDNRPEHLAALDPPPASIDLGRDTIAHLAVERLLLRMRQGTNSQPVTIVFPPTLSGPESPSSIEKVTDQSDAQAIAVG